MKVFYFIPLSQPRRAFALICLFIWLFVSRIPPILTDFSEIDGSLVENQTITHKRSKLLVQI